VALSATPDAPMTVAEQQKRRVLNKRVMRAVMLGMGVLTLAIMARTLQHSPAAAPGAPGRAAVAAAESRGGQDAGACRLRAWGES